MNMEPDPLDFLSVLNNYLRTDWSSTKGPAQKANQIVLCFWRVSPRGLIPITPSGIGGNNRTHIREYSLLLVFFLLADLYPGTSGTPPAQSSLDSSVLY